MKYNPPVEVFLKDVAEHGMEVMHDSGVYRHLHFQKKGTRNHWFDLVTWPGVLIITGDMGTWTFYREHDMFGFFRNGRDMTDKYAINPYYWSDKLQHGIYDGREGAEVWDEELWKSDLLAQLTGDYGFKGKKLEEITEAIEDDIFIHEGEGPDVMRAAAYNFEYTFEDDMDRFMFDRYGLPSGMKYSCHFIWCCYAIQWGIQQWDKRTEQERRELF